jgi:protein-disulfide isomerase
VFTSGRADGLDGVFAPGSALAGTDRSRLAELRAAGQQLNGFAPEVAAVTAVTATGAGFRLELTERIPAYAVVTGPDGRQDVPGRPDRPVVMTVVATPQGWRIATAELVP